MIDTNADGASFAEIHNLEMNQHKKQKEIYSP
jgi:hypothetical protein